MAVVEMCRALREAGVDAEIAATNADGHRNSTLEEARKRAGEGIPAQIFRRLPPYAYMTSPSMAVWLALHTREYDIVHVHALFSHPTTLGCLWSRVHGVPYIIRPLGLLDPWCLNQNRMRKQAYWALADRVNLRHAAALHFTSDAEAKEAQWVPPSVRHAVIPLGAPARKTLRLPTREAFLKKHSIPPGHSILLFLSRINPKKGLDLLAPALGDLKKRGDRFVLLVAGPDEDGYRARVEEMFARAGVAGEVRFLGLVAGEDKESLLLHSDLFVLPSYQENFAISAVEAMQRGLPVVISDRVGIHSYVTQWKAGAVVRCSSEELAATLHRLLADRDGLKKMGRNGIHLVEAEFSWHDATRRLERLYREIRNPTRKACVR